MKCNCQIGLRICHSDEEAMEHAVLDKKVSNVIGQMGFDLDKIHESETLQQFFEF